MRSRFLLPLPALLIPMAAACPASAIEPPVEPSSAIDSLEDVEIDGSRQKILIQGDDRANPILLWLHGGPGEPAMLLAHHFSSMLKRHLTIVHWDQPGAGLSYDPKHPPKALSEKRIEDDALRLTDTLLRRFGRERIYLLGHSFGALIGLRVVAARPDLFCAYVGVGQVVNETRSMSLTRQWLREEMTRAGDGEGLKRLARAGFNEIFDMVKARGGVLHGRVDYAAIIRSSPYYFDGYWERKQEAKKVTWRLMGKANPEPMDISRIRALRVPAYFLSGRFDHVPATSPELVEAYVRQLRAPRKELVWFENSGHLPNLDEPDRFQEVIRDTVLAGTRGCGGPIP